ncbi:hypothetical protein TNCT_646001 [Trichonephila clavata]|uniref:Uncharacterized protein n=1 Tax=Trichonephila clavata TaxID=2740835 RepID=A0A8X6G8D5_TRICU|nr:hypothetical protein TNCT_646001 [Trichonephila clavata]
MFQELYNYYFLSKFYHLTPSVDEEDCSRREAALLRGRGLGFPLHTLLCTGNLSGKKVRPHTEHGTSWDCTEDQAGSSTPSSASRGRRGGSLRRLGVKELFVFFQFFKRKKYRMLKTDA